MKILFPISYYLGGTHLFVKRAFEKLGHEVITYKPRQEKDLYSLGYYLKFRQISKYKHFIGNKVEKQNNKDLMALFIAVKPDLVFSINWRFYPEIINYCKQKRIITASWVQDNPFDNQRFKYFPITLKYFDFLFIADKVWYQNIRNIAPKPKFHHLVGAYDPDYFKPVTCSNEDNNKYKCQLSFAGTSYGFTPEGVYRAAIIDQIADYDIKIWGDKDWQKYFKFYPNLKQVYKGERLNFSDLNKLYQISDINLNLPSPQLYTTFQQRVFEIAAAKGFQIVDYRSDIDEFFNEEEIVTFKNISELKEKLEYFLKYPEKRLPYIEKSFIKVWNKHTYENRMKEMLEKLKQ